MTCKACDSSAINENIFTKQLKRPDFDGRELQFNQCRTCGFLFTNSYEHFTDGDWQRFYSYPEYLKYDPAAITGRRDERTLMLIEHVRKNRLHMERAKPKVLLHGNGTSHVLFSLWVAGYDVYATYSPFPSDQFPMCLTIEQAMAKGDFEIVCAIEVAEHFYDPQKEFALVDKMLKKGGVFCGTTCLNEGISVAEMAGDWHYLRQHTINAGHVASWTNKAFDAMAKRLGWKNFTEHGTPAMREKAHMPSTSVFFQFQK